MRRGVIFSIVSLCVCGSAWAQTAPIGSNPPDLMEYRRDQYMLKLRELIDYPTSKGYMFAKWFAIGDAAKFQEVFDRGCRITVVPTQDAEASYEPGGRAVCLKVEPGEFGMGFVAAGQSSALLWHEAIHAVSNFNEEGFVASPQAFKGAPNVITSGGADDVKPLGEQLEYIDHLYIEWAEGIVQSIPRLEKIDQLLKANDKATPPADVKAKTQEHWRVFMEACTTSSFGQVPTPDERKELERMVGFRCDPNDILVGYLNLGYSPEYFSDFVTDAEVWSWFPGGDELGCGDLTPTKDKSRLEDIEAIYTMGWHEGPPGRSCSVRVSLFGSPEIARVMYDFSKQYAPNQTPLPDVGDDAFISSRSGDADRVHAIYRNVTMTIVNANFTGGVDDQPLALQKRTVAPNVLKRIFKHIEDRNLMPIPSGVITVIPPESGTAQPATTP